MMAERWQTVPQILGLLYLRPFLPSEDMQAFAKQVKDYTEAHFVLTDVLCQDRNDTSDHGTTCAELLQFCGTQGTES